MSPAAARLHAALLAAFRRLAADADVASLDRELHELLSQPYAAQRRTPGEIVRAALAAAGRPDADLGDEVRAAQLAWGAAKAQALTAPVVLYVGNHLMDRSQIGAAVEAAGLRLVANATAGDAGGAVRAFVDLTHPGADDAIRSLAGTGVTIVAFGPHVDDVALVRARALGADDALPRSVFFRRLPELLPARA